MTRALSGLAAVPLAKLRPSPNNPRENLTDIDGLAQSIAETGLLQPLVVQRIPGEDAYQIVAGHRRFAAVRKVGLREVPCLIRRDMLPDEELLAMLVENGQRAGLDPIEEAHALNRLADMGLSKIDIAKRAGVSSATVAGRLALLQLPADEQEAIRAGHVPVGRALAGAAAERQRERVRLAGRPVGRPKGAKTAPYFGPKHPLAQAAQRFCEHRRGRPKVGGIACGECWESVIRADERATRQEIS